MNDLSAAIECCRLLDATEVATAANLPKSKESRKWACPACPSSDALHVYQGPGRGAHCFSCGGSFDAVGLVMGTAKLEFKASVEWLATQFGFSDLISGTVDLSEVKKRRAAIDAEMQKREAERKRLDAERMRQAQGVFTRFWGSLTLGPAGQEYLQSRAIPLDVAEHFGLVSIESEEQLQAVHAQFWPDELEVAGLVGVNERGLYPFPWRTPCLVIPYADEGGLSFLRFRDLSGGTPKYISPRGLRPTGPWNAHASYDHADHYPTLYICEGELNALSVILAGQPALGSCGNGIWLPEWSKGFRYYQRVVILCDGDEPGIRFSERVKAATSDALGPDWVKRRLRRRIFRQGTDANDVLQQGVLGEVLNAA